MTLMGYTSRNIPSPRTFEDVLETRMKAKAEGNKALNYALKLVVNTTYGAMLNQYNDLYDPLMGRSVCITGQLFLLELTEHLYQDIESLTICQNNTDGLMVEFDEEDYPRVQEIVQEWQDRTGFELEEDKIIKIVQKDVNGYLEIQEDGAVKAKGGYLVRGIAPAGAFNINNNAPIVAKALVEYFAHGTPLKETIMNCKGIKEFQLIAKAGSKYSRAYQIVDGVEVDTQKVNRVYATKDERYGKLYKVHGETGRTAKIESLPDHCIIDNSNELSIDSVDKEWYIKLAQKRVNDYLGIKPEKKGKRTMENETKTPETVEAEAPAEKKTTKTRKPKVEAAVPAIEVKPMNVYQKLLEARAKFLEAGTKKSGKNMHLQFMYFELEDIVPAATKIFREVGLIPIVNFTESMAIMRVANVDNPVDSVEFTAPFNQIKPIVSNAGKQATNEMQALGSSITYMRRYLYMIALDICEADDFDANVGSPVKVDTPPVGGSVLTTHIPVSAPKANPAPQASKIPVSSENRQAIANNLTNADGPATELQIGQLKTALAELLKKDPSKEQTVQTIALKTNGFTKVSKTECENTMKAVSMLLKGGAQA